MSPIKCGYSKCDIMFEPTRKHQKYCCPNHQVYAFRERQKASKTAGDKERETRVKNWTGQLRRYRPKTARSLDAFFSEYGADPKCQEMALRLVMAAISEERQSTKVPVQG